MYITTTNISYNSIAIGFSSPGEALVLLQTDANQITYTYFNGTNFILSSSTTLPVTDIPTMLVKYSAGKFVVLMDCILTGSKASNPIYWATTPYLGTSLAPTMVASPIVSNGLQFDLDNNGNTLALWQNSYGGGPGSGGASTFSYLFINADGTTNGGVQQYPQNDPASYSNLLRKLLFNRKATFLNTSPIIVSGSPTLSNANVFFTGSSDPNTQWVIPFSYFNHSSTSSTNSIQALAVDGSGNTKTIDSNGKVAAVTIYTAPSFDVYGNPNFISNLLSANFSASKMILAWEEVSNSYYAVYPTANLLGSSPTSSFSPYDSAITPSTLSVFDGVAFFSQQNQVSDFSSSSGHNKSLIIKWGIVPPSETLSAQLLINLPGVYNVDEYVVNPTSITPTAIFSWLDANGALFSIEE